MDHPRPILEHLEELRRRLIVIIGVFIGFFSLILLFSKKLTVWLSNLAGGLVFLAPAEAFLAHLKVSLIVSFLLTLPILIYEAWRFVAVALTPKEKKWLFFVLPASYGLFLLGVGFGGIFVLPAAVKILLGFGSEGLVPMLSIDRFIGFTGWILAGFGLMFQLPLAVLVFVKIGIFTPATLRHYRPHVVVGLSIMAAVLTPGPDVISQLLLFVPTYLLFELSLLLSKLIK